MINLKKELYNIGFVIFILSNIIFIFCISSNLSEICPKSISIYLNMIPIFFMIMCFISTTFLKCLVPSYNLTLKLNYYVLLFPFICFYKNYKNKQLDSYIKSFERY